MSNEKKTNVNIPVYGYKVFNPDWTCNPIFGPTKQYACPGKFEEEGEIEIGEHGMHFYQNIVDCFIYYKFSPENKVAEVIAYGDVLTLNNESCTNKLEIVREIPWSEVLALVGNTGRECTGFRNTGDCNSGDYNSGCKNSGDWNTGDYNQGCFNSGMYNIGNHNTGILNYGNQNVGSHNSGNNNSGNFNNGDFNTRYENLGNYNSGCSNFGNYNSGHENIGNHNTGNNNSGNKNTGHRNIGSSNSGDWNKSDYNSGCFNVKEHKIMMFDKPSDMTYQEWQNSEAYALLDKMPDISTKWVDVCDMTNDEMDANPSYKATHGYLKTINDTESRQKWWNALSNSDKAVIKAIPNFDSDIFYECTGIRVD